MWNGLGPKRWDIPPYGPPVIHMMIHQTVRTATSTTTTTTFVNVPILFTKTTLELTKFYGSDYRGPAWVVPTTKSKTQARRWYSRNAGSGSGDEINPERYQITKWEPIPEKNHINVEMDIYVPQSSNHPVNDIPATTTTSILSSQKQVLCPSSYLYGFPTSFFVEPIAVCAPSLLNFFQL